MNNFDQSSTGVNISLNIGYDTNRSQFEFDECFVRLKDNSLLYNGGYISDTHEVIYDLPEVKQIFKDFYDFEHVNSVETCTLRDIIDSLSSLGLEQPLRTMDKDEFLFYLDCYFNANYGTLKAFLEKTYEKINHIVIESRGYSQGDYEAVVLHSKLVEELEGNVDNTLHEHINNLLWRCPIYGRIEITTDATTIEIHLDEYMKDIYNYDSEEAVNIILTNSQVVNLPKPQQLIIKQFLLDNIPSEPTSR